MKKFLHFGWLRALQFLGNTVPKKEIQCQKRNSVPKKETECKFF